ncbi:hypothetical protein CBOM_07490 [Ceraceosorus bombacis]|uniref:Uncharacterized protein n=1 Tax=Ceraceosorus bombacis TaxID=401625 RepID=A0A0P1BCS6_9BASI|nr:hypothetical protein CBOM_07490 [Ceraceosorus bombacis]
MIIAGFDVCFKVRIRLFIGTMRPANAFSTCTLSPFPTFPCNGPRISLTYDQVIDEIFASVQCSRMNQNSS